MKKMANTKTIAELFLYTVLLVMGIAIVVNPWVGESNPLFYIACMFIIFAFFAFVAYFIGKKEDDYELLLLSLLNIAMAVFLYYYKEGDLPMVLSYSLSAWSFFYITLKFLTAFLYKATEYKKYATKILVTIIVLILSAVSIFRLFNDDIMLDLTTYGYYFIIVAALNFLEVCLTRITYSTNDEESFKFLDDKTTSKSSAKPIKILVEDIDSVEVLEAPVKKTFEKKPVSKEVVTSRTKRLSTVEAAKKRAAAKTEEVKTTVKKKTAAAKKTTTKKVAEVKKAAAKKVATVKKAAATKKAATAKKTVAKKAAPAKKAVAKKPATKATVKKTTTVKKAATKKAAPAKKTTTKKVSK